MTPEMAITLALLSPAKEPPRTAAPLVIPAAKVRIPQAMPVGPVQVPAGWHVHRCAHGHEPVEWAHPDTSRNNVQQHQCPVCGMVHWNPVRHGPTTLASQAARPAPSVRQTLYVCSTVPCPHCVTLERSMQDEEVKWAMTAYDVRRLSTTDPVQAAQIEKLGVTRFPTLVIVEADGSRFWAPLEGHRDPRPLAFWLREAVHRPLTGQRSPQPRTAPAVRMASRYCPPGQH